MVEVPEKYLQKFDSISDLISHIGTCMFGEINKFMVNFHRCEYAYCIGSDEYLINQLDILKNSVVFFGNMLSCITGEVCFDDKSCVQYYCNVASDLYVDDEQAVKMLKEFLYICSCYCDTGSFGDIKRFDGCADDEKYREYLGVCVLTLEDIRVRLESKPKFYLDSSWFAYHWDEERIFG